MKGLFGDDELGADVPEADTLGGTPGGEAPETGLLEADTLGGGAPETELLEADALGDEALETELLEAERQEEEGLEVQRKREQLRVVLEVRGGREREQEAQQEHGQQNWDCG